VVVQRQTLSTAVSMGYVHGLQREDPDYFPLMLALSHLGEHRQFNGVLFNELREKRGMNYGNYAYLQHFIEEPGTTYSVMNIPRQQQDFSIWIRPVEPKNGAFATRGALYFLDLLRQQGIPEDRFELTRGFLEGYTRLWAQTSQRRLGQAIDDVLHGTPGFLEKLRASLKTITREQVNAAVKKHLDPSKVAFAFVTEDAAGLKAELTAAEPTPMSYPSPKAPAVLEVDKSIQAYKLPVTGVEIVDVKTVMQQ
jgi:zinc protease